MTQANLGTIDPDSTSGTELATLLSNWEDALLSSHGGSERPTYAQHGTVWLDTDGDDDTAYFYDSASDVDVPLYQLDLSDGVMRIGFSGDMGTYIKPSATTGMWIFSNGVEVVDLGQSHFELFASHRIENDKIAFGTVTVDGSARVVIECRSGSPALAIQANGIASGNSERHSVAARYTGDETEFFWFPKTDGSAETAKRLYYSHVDGEWGFNVPLQLRNTGNPSGTPADTVWLFSAAVSGSHELRAEDEAGNRSTLSPHNQSMLPNGFSESLAWSYYSEKWAQDENGTKYLAGRINVDMLQVVRLVEELYSQIKDEPIQLVYKEEFDAEGNPLT